MKQAIALFCILLCAKLSAQNAIQPIQDSMANYEFEKAIMLIEKEQPTEQLLLLKAKALRGLLRYDEAVTAMRQVVKKQPDNITYLFDLAEYCKVAGRLVEALECYENTLTLNPENEYAQLQKISLLLSIERYKLAHKACTELLARDTTTVALRLMANCYDGMNKLDSATVYYQKVIAKSPEDYGSVARLSRIYISTDMYNEAIELTEDYRINDTTNIYVNRQNAQAYCLNKEYKTAINRYESLVAQGDESNMTNFYLGISYFADDCFYDAYDYFEKCLKQTPESANVLYYQGRACANTFRAKEGLRHLQEAFKQTIPSNETVGKLHAAMAECYSKLPDWTKFIASLTTQLELEPDKIYNYYRIGAAYQDGLKDLDNAEKYITRYMNLYVKKHEEDAKLSGSVLLAEENTAYKAAARRLERIKKEKFWQKGTDAETQTPSTVIE
ncbi:hypothetical protein D0T50_12660 [Bacteroides sp. 214]|uniref:tetratricopeptide repeat protein n=1 Tax=Bacteroides sp. 214 TaxID=2302935 RepID=UPI0013D46C1B|nr:tetratricopeptide repeat protein [Bacteroides sp. 214]NDW13734.1 hypothetical protein [Bacteroides sp. 214]